MESMGQLAPEAMGRFKALGEAALAEGAIREIQGVEKTLTITCTEGERFYE
jgi:hypothetical protein